MTISNKIFRTAVTALTTLSLSVGLLNAQECSDPKIAFILDDSGSIDSNELAVMNTSIALIASKVTALSAGATFGSVQYGMNSGPATNGSYAVAHGYQAVPSTLVNLSFQQDHLPDSLDQMMDDGLFTSGALANPDATFIFTDGARTSGGCCSNLENQPSSSDFSADALPGFGEYARLAALNSTGNVSMFHAAPGVPHQVPGAAQGGGIYVGTVGSFDVTEAQAEDIAASLCPTPEPDPVEINKECTTPELLEDGNYAAACQITITAETGPGNHFYFVREELLDSDGNPNPSAIQAFTSAGWECSPPSAPVPTCFIRKSDFPASGEAVFDVEVLLPSATIDPWENCASVSELLMSPESGVSIDMIWEAFDRNSPDTLASSCVPLITPPVAPSITKTCETATWDGHTANVECKIIVDTGTPSTSGWGFGWQDLIVDEAFTGLAGGDNSTITSISSTDPWVCTDPLPVGAADAVSCQVDPADIGGNTVSVIDVSLVITDVDPDGEYENCATLSRPNPSDAIIHDEDGNIIHPDNVVLDTSCWPIELHPPLDEPRQCSAFEPKVECDGNGNWTVTLDNIHAGDFSPTEMTVTSLTTGVEVLRQGLGLTYRLTGVSPGDTVQISTSAIEEGAGDGAGLDLCCMGEIEITIPEGEVCEPRETDVVLEVEKTCELNDIFAHTTECTFTVHYEGPAPTAGNPIKITDVMQSTPWTYQGITGSTHMPDFAETVGWVCNPDAPHSGPAPVECALDADHAPGEDWSNFDSTFVLAYDTPDAFRNCAISSTWADGGTQVGNESCFEIGDQMLEIVKTLAEGDTCIPYHDCTFIIQINNLGSTDYNGLVTLVDLMTVGGIPDGDILGMTPALCADPTDLVTAAGCTGTVSIPASGSITFEITAEMSPIPTLLEHAENCVNLADQTSWSAADGDDGSHTSCVPFDVIVETPPSLDVDVSIEKIFTNPGPVASIHPEFDLVPVLVSGALQPGDVVTITDDFGADPLGNAVVYMSHSAPNLPWVCSTTTNGISCSQIIGSSGALDMTPIHITGMSALAEWVNCAHTSVFRDGVVVTETDMENNAACVANEVVGDPGPIDLAVEKILMTEEPTGEPTFNLIPSLVSGTLTPGMVITIVDNFDLYTGAIPLSYLSHSAPNPPWTCELLSNGISCSQVIGASGTLDTTPVTITGVSPITTWGNCTTIDLTDGTNPITETEEANNTACVLSSDIPEPEGIDMSVVKRTEGPSGDGQISFSITANVDTGNLQPGDIVRVTDAFNGVGVPGDSGVSPEGHGVTYLSHSAPNPPWVCTESGGVVDCQQVIGIDGLFVPTPIFISGYLNGEEYKNCSAVSIIRDGNAPAPETGAGYDNNMSCVSGDWVVPRAPEGAPILEIRKTQIGHCDVNKGARYYSCDFAISVTNVGSADYTGPIVIDDTFGNPAPTNVDVDTPAGWSCPRSNGDGVSCLIGTTTLAPGGSADIGMSLRIPGLVEGGVFQQCAAIGIGKDTFQRALVIQTAMQALGFDGGPVDGAPGPKTRAGVAALQTRMGLEPTGEISDELFVALGVPLAGAPACVNVRLEPIPIVCGPEQKINSRGECYTPRAECGPDQQRNSAGRCYTPRADCEPGQKRNSAGACYFPRAQVCDAATTIKRGDACACRFRGMRQTSATSCGCKRGTVFVAGAGCQGISITPGDGHEGGACLVVGGIRICR